MAAQIRRHVVKVMAIVTLMPNAKEPLNADVGVEVQIKFQDLLSLITHQVIGTSATIQLMFTMEQY